MESKELYDVRANIKDMTLSEIESFILHLGKQRYRARQIMKWLYQSGATSFEEMTNLSKSFRKEIEELARIGSLLIETIQESKDGTKKILFKLEDGNCIESVVLQEKNHLTLCISTQVGCRMGCRFCLTGRQGLRRNLEVSEIVDQIATLRFGIPEGRDIKNIVMMGMGEPLLNYENVLKAIDIITSDMGLSFSKRRITVSTCGIVPMIYQLGKDRCVNLAVSLNATDNETRSYLMPVNRKYPLEELIAACREYPMPRRRMITFEYILIDSVNDRKEDAERLSRLMEGIHCKFNLIPFNEFPESDLKKPSKERVQRFRDMLIKNNFTATIRPSKGSDILAACGQLSGRARA
jgi:23S rRNA (adenine2503-C2)-methyltransferase